MKAWMSCKQEGLHQILGAMQGHLLHTNGLKKKKKAYMLQNRKT